MRIKPDELENEGFVLKESLEHKELIPFVRLYLKKKTKISSFYTVANLTILRHVLASTTKFCPSFFVGFKFN